MATPRAKFLYVLQNALITQYIINMHFVISLLIITIT